MPDTDANPLLLGWLKEWWDDAREKNSKGVLTYKKAYQSVKACPITFSHPSEAIQLNGLGPKLCERLTAKLEIHCRDHALPMPEKPHKANKRTSTDGAADDAPAKKPRKTKPYVPTLRSGPYAILVALSGLSEASGAGMTKNELIESAQAHCDSSFTAPADPTKFYTAWNSMKTLQGKDLVYEFGRPTKRYALTEEGWEAAKRINSVGSAATTMNAIETVSAEPASRGVAVIDKTASEQSAPPVSRAPPVAGFQHIDVIDLDGDDDDDDDDDEGDTEEGANSVSMLPTNSISTAKRTTGLSKSRSDAATSRSMHLAAHSGTQRPPSALPETHARPPANPRSSRTVKDVSFEPIHIPPGAFTVELILDNREVRAKTDHAYIQNTLVSHGVTPTTRGLPLGDALWVARLKPEFASLLSSAGEDGTPTEILLSHIVERKRLDDLIGSIKDGRFHEQKFRLKRSGIPNVSYVIEDIALSQETPQRTWDMIASAIAGTMTVGGFFVKRTRKLDDTIAYLARMTKLLRKRFEHKALHIVPSHALGDGRDAQRIKSLLKDEAHFLTFDAFAALAGKSDSLTLRDVFLKMLMCTRGITGDKAMEIQRRWKTPKEFVDALEREQGHGGGDEGERKRKELVFRAAGQLIGRKQIGKAVSARVGDVWGEA